MLRSPCDASLEWRAKFSAANVCFLTVRNFPCVFDAKTKEQLQWTLCRLLLAVQELFTTFPPTKNNTLDAGSGPRGRDPNFEHRTSERRRKRNSLTQAPLSTRAPTLGFSWPKTASLNTTKVLRKVPLFWCWRQKVQGEHLVIFISRVLNLPKSEKP